MPQNEMLFGPKAPFYLLYSIAAALLVGGLLIIVLWTPAPRPRNREIDSSSTKLKCHRIQGIPITTTKDELQSQLAEYLQGSAADIRLTLARSPRNYLTATIMLYKPPLNSNYEVDSSFIGITPLFEREDAVVDIIAVPGLGSHAIGGFKVKYESNVWLRDFLPDDIPTARVLIYGYDTAIAEKNAKYSIADLAKAFLDSYKSFRKDTQTSRRPIILIGHSLGGLIIKEALSMSLKGHNDPRNSDFFKSSYGLVFFGVPNLGLRQGRLKEITDGQLNEQLIRDLEVDRESEPTPYIRELTKKFIECSEAQEPPFKIISYYEQRKTPTAKKMENGTLSMDGEPCFMVTQDSACRIGLEDRDHDKQPLDLNHSNLVKFPSRFNDNYVRVLSTLNILVQEAPEAVRGRFSEHKLSEDERRHWDDLNVPDYRAFRDNVEKLARPAEGTLQWLVSSPPSEVPTGANSLQKEDFVEWRESTKSGPLLVIGPPGQGKSVLSNFVVDNLNKFVEETRSSSKVIYYFCNIKNEQSSRTASNILRALIVQLSEDGRLFRRLPNRFQDRHEPKNFYLASFDELWRTFDDLVKLGVYTWIYSVIDGLDVYEAEMKELLSRMKTSVAKATYPLKLFCTSRPTDLVINVLLSAKRHLRTPQKDLELFIDERLQEFLDDWGSNMVNIIREALIRRAGGRFLWISIMLRELRSQPYTGVPTFKEVISHMPQELEELYENLVQAAFDKHKYNIAILAWITYAKRPLSLKELETATATMVNVKDSSWKDCCTNKPRLSSSNDVLKSLGTLVDVVDDRLYLIHQSLRDFLLKTDLWGQRRELQILQPEAALGNACLTFLSFKDFEVAAEAGGETIRLDQDPFLGYAAKHWYQHIHKARDVDYEKLQRLLQGPNQRLWLKYRTLRGYGVDLDTSSICDIAIFFDIAWLASMLLNKVSHDISEIFRDDCLAKAAASGPGVLGELLHHSETSGIKVTDAVMEAAAGNTENGVEVMKMLLEERCDQVEITKKLVEAAAENWSSGKEIMIMLLKEYSDQFNLTQEMIRLITENFDERVMKLLLAKRGNEVKITEEVMKAAAGHSGGEGVMKLLLEERGEGVKITEEVVKAAAGHSLSEEVMKLLLEERGDEVKITEEVVKAAARNLRSGEGVIKLLLEERGDEVKITEEVVKAAAGNYWRGKGVMKLLLKERGKEVKITEEVVKAAARNWGSGEGVMKLLLKERGDEVRITEEVVKAAARNFRSGEGVMKLLLKERGDEVKITEEVVKAVARNWGSGEGVMKLLLEERGNEVKITEEVVKAAVRNFRSGEEVIKLLLEERDNEVKITEEVVKAAARNWGSGEGVMKLLLEERGNEVKITEEVVKAAAGNEERGVEVLTLLLEMRADDVVASISESVCLAAATCGQNKVLDLLCRRNSLLPLREEWISIAKLYNAAKTGDADCLQRLLRDGVQPDLKTIRSQTPLWVAAQRGHQKVVELLVQRDDVNVDSLSEDGRPPIFLPAANGNEDIVALLIDAGADPTIADDNGETALSIAKKNRRKQVVRILERTGAEAVEKAQP